MKIVSRISGGLMCFVLAATCSLLLSDIALAQVLSGSSRQHATRQLRRGFQPAHYVMMQEETQAESRPVVPSIDVSPNEESVLPEVIDGGVYYENAEGELIFSNGAPSPMTASAGGCSDGNCFSCCFPCFNIPAGSLEAFAGVQGFTGPANLGGNGSFGFHEGLNWGVPLVALGNCLSGQIGFRATQSNLSGAEFTNDGRYQGFVTAGLFRRVDCGLQGGLVIDWLTDDWYREADLTVLRGELSWVFFDIHDFGFWFSANTRETTVASAFDPNSGLNNTPQTWQATDLYSFFYRRRLGCRRDGEARIYAGWSGNSDGLIGTDARFPISNSLAIEGGFAYLIPNEGNGTGLQAGHVQESWNVGISLVWYPGRRLGYWDEYSRPLFRVADNSTFMVDGF